MTFDLTFDFFIFDLNIMSFEYGHLPQSEDLGPKGRSYIAAEKVIEFRGKKILVLETEASDISFCDSSHACQLRTFIVKGYIRKWKFRTSPDGMNISLLEALKDSEEKKELHEYLQKTYNMDNIV